eukprot:168378-Prorocentrum_minimum.AAC.1
MHIITNITREVKQGAGPDLTEGGHLTPTAKLQRAVDICVPRIFGPWEGGDGGKVVLGHRNKYHGGVRATLE